MWTSSVDKRLQCRIGNAIKICTFFYFFTVCVVLVLLFALCKLALMIRLLN